MIEDILTKKVNLTVTQPEASAVVAVSQAGVGLDIASQLAQAELQSVEAVRLLDARQPEQQRVLEAQAKELWRR